MKDVDRLQYSEVKMTTGDGFEKISGAQILFKSIILYFKIICHTVLSFVVVVFLFVLTRLSPQRYPRLPPSLPAPAGSPPSSSSALFLTLPTELLRHLPPSIPKDSAHLFPRTAPRRPCLKNLSWPLSPPPAPCGPTLSPRCPLPTPPPSKPKPAHPRLFPP